MRRLATSLIAVIAAAVAVVSCSDTQPTAGPQIPAQTSTSPTPCTANVSTLEARADTLFGAASPYLAPVRDTLAAIGAKLRAGATSAAQAQAEALAAYVESKAGTIAGGAHQIDAFVSNLLCWVGVAQQHTFIVSPSDQPQVLKTSDGAAGIQLPANAVASPTVITITVVDADLLTTDDTKLDKYPRSVSVNASGAVAPSTVAVCVKDIPSSVFAHLRLGHRTSAGFRIEEPASVAFLGCPGDATTVAARSRVKRWLNSLASLVLPAPLYARMQDAAFTSGGVGGTAGEYSPFEPVDTQLLISGGVGGTAGEYIATPVPAASPGVRPKDGTRSATPGSAWKAPGGLRGASGRANTVVGGVCTAVEAIVGTALEPECRPRMEIATANGTVLQGVPVSWAIGVGSGSTAPEDPSTRACGLFASTAAATTNADGKAGACWTLGAVVGLNTLIATPGVGGDAPAGVTFFPLNKTFSANALSNTPAVAATGEVTLYDGLPHPGSGACSNGLTPALTYSGNGSVPRNVGHYTLTVSCGGGTTLFIQVSATADITIGLAVPVIAISCPSSVLYTGSAQTPCSATVSAPGLSLAPTPAYTANIDAGRVTATVAYAGAANYAAASASREFTIGAAPTTTTVSCPASRVYTGSAIRPCTATVVGPNDLSLTPAPGYSANVTVGTAIASYNYPGGDNYLPSADSRTFLITAAPSATSLSCPGAVTYTGAPQNPCTAVATGAGALNQPVAVTLAPLPAINARTYAASAAFSGDANHSASGATSTFSITPAAATASAGSGTMVYGGVVPILPCSINVLSVDAASVTCSTSLPPSGPSPGVNVTTPTVSPPSVANYTLNFVTGTLTVTFVQQACFAAPIAAALPPTTAGLPKGSTVTVKCTLLDARGQAVQNATGNLRVQDVGPNGLGAPVQVLFKAVAFSPGAGGYSYPLDTSPAGFVAGHYYQLTATWNDGSTTSGFIYLRQHRDDDDDRR